MPSGRRGFPINPLTIAAWIHVAGQSFDNGPTRRSRRDSPVTYGLMERGEKRRPVNADAVRAGLPKSTVAHVKDDTFAGLPEQPIDPRSVPLDAVGESEIPQDRQPRRLDHEPGADRLRLFEALEQGDVLARPGEQ